MKHNRTRTKKQRQATALAKWTTRRRRAHFMRIVQGLVDRATDGPMWRIERVFIGHKWGPKIIADEANRRVLRLELQAMKNGSTPTERISATNRAIVRVALSEPEKAFKDMMEHLAPMCVNPPCSALASLPDIMQRELVWPYGPVKPEEIELEEWQGDANCPNLHFEASDPLRRTNERMTYALSKAELHYNDLAVDQMRETIARRMNAKIAEGIAASLGLGASDR